MLAGLLFATHDADDRPGQLAATLPFAGTTLIEYQARLLVAAGASQLVVVAPRVTPELRGALGRVARREVAVDPITSAAEAAGRLHPLASVLMLADGLVTVDPVVRALAAEAGDVLLVTAGDDPPPGLERLGGGLLWAGAARFGHDRLFEAAALPRDYDPQSALLRVVAQSGAAHLMLPRAVEPDGHAVERRADVLQRRNRAVVAGMAADRARWFDRLLVAPLAGALLPPLLARGSFFMLLAASGLALAGATTAFLGWSGVGVTMTLLGAIAARLARVEADLLDDLFAGRTADVLSRAGPAAAVLALGADGGGALLAATLALVALAGLGERAIGEEPECLSGSPAAYLLPVAVGAWAGLPLWGVAVAAAYAAATAWRAVERLRRRLGVPSTIAH